MCTNHQNRTRMHLFSAGMVLLLFACLLQGTAIPARNVPAVVPTIHLVFEDPHPDKPWQEKLKRKQRSGVYLGNGRFLVYAGYPAEWLRAASVLVSGLPEFSAALLDRDDALGFIILEVDTEARQLLRRRRIASVEWLKNFKYSKSGQSMRVVAHRKRARDIPVHYEGIDVGRAPAGVGLIPRIQFNGWVRDIEPGDQLVAQGRLLGLVIDYDSQSRLGFAIPQNLLNYFVKTRLRKPEQIKGIEFIDWRRKKERPYRSVLVHPGLEGRALTSRTEQKFYGLGPTEGGLVITRTYAWMNPRQHLQPGDVILAVDGRRIEPGGQLIDPILGHISAQLFLSMLHGRPRSALKFSNLRIVREGVRRTLRLYPVVITRKILGVPHYESRPAYMIQGGLVMVHLSGHYLNQRKNTSARLNFLYKENRFKRKDLPARVVVLDRVLPLEINQGYQSVQGRQVVSLNGVVVRNLTHLHQLQLEALRVNRDLALRLDNGEVLVLDHSKIRLSEELTRKTYGIPFLEHNLDD